MTAPESIVRQRIAPKLIAIDIDGTLMPSSGTRIADRTCAALRAAQAAGLEIVIATGRRQGYALPLLAEVGLRDDSVMISSNGAVMRTFAGDLMERRFLPVETSRRLCGVMREFGAMVFTFDREGPGGLVIEDAAPLNARIAKWVEANRPYLAQIKPLERAFDAGEPAIQGMVAGTIARMREAEQALRRRDVSAQVAMHRTEYAERDLSILDLLPPAVSKGTALKTLADLRGIRREQVMAIGDNLNDMEMLEYAGTPVVMANSAAELLVTASERGWRQTASNDEYGVALAVEALLCPEGAMSGRRAGGVRVVECSQ